MIPKKEKDNFAYEGPWKESTPGALTTFIKELECGSFTFSPVLSPLDQSKELTGHQWQSHLALK